MTLTGDAKQLRISGKNLGELSLAHHCPRCVWAKLKLSNQLPFQIFPGIFSSIDGYTKKVVHSWFDDLGSAPGWLEKLGDIASYIEPPHHSKFFLVDDSLNVKLTGAADGIYRRSDGSYVIVDYKTAKYSDGQDELLPIYETQLNSYTLIAEATGLAPVSGLALIYMEPCTTEDDARASEHRHALGFGMRFCATVKQVELRRESIRPLMTRARELYDFAIPPEGRAECKDCKNTVRLISTLSASATR